MNGHGEIFRLESGKRLDDLDEGVSERVVESRISSRETDFFGGEHARIEEEMPVEAEISADRPIEYARRTERFESP